MDKKIVAKCVPKDLNKLSQDLFIFETRGKSLKKGSSPNCIKKAKLVKRIQFNFEKKK